MIRFLLKTFCAVTLLTGAGWIYGLWTFQNKIFQYPSAVSQADGIVVFTGGHGRIKKGLELLKHQAAPILLISGIYEELQHLPVVSDLALETRSKIQLGHFARDTVTNVQETKDWVNHHHLKSVILVTSHYHIPRSLLLLSQALPHITFIPHPFMRKEFHGKEWWKDPVLQKVILTEYNKYLITWVKIKIGIQ